MGNGETFDLPVRTGEHSIRLRLMLLLGSVKRSASSAPNSIVKLRCRPVGWLGTLVFFIRELVVCAHGTAQLETSLQPVTPLSMTYATKGPGFGQLVRYSSSLAHLFWMWEQVLGQPEA
jgi:hypothetical protein